MSMSIKLRGLWHEYRGLALFIALMLLFRSVIADWNTVPTGSMQPTIVEGDRILVNKMAYDFRLPFSHISLLRTGEPQRGDIVIFDSVRADKRMVKRVIALPGDLVAMVNKRLNINGQWLNYSASDKSSLGKEAQTYQESLAERDHPIRIYPGERSGLSDFSPVEVPEGHYLVLGDNRDRSADSRVYGFIPRKEIVGRSRSVVLSLDYDNYYLPRANRFLIPLAGS
ncbi:MAG: signal peptidase I [Pseudomonadota bacterium]